ncbi:hypothetical protein JW859_00420 [bacterium]|nr:hypothetical protein [bacterium]
MRKSSLLIALLALVPLITGCPAGGDGNGQASGTSTSGGSAAPAAPAIQVTLVQTDLGLDDGYLVRDAAAALTALAGRGLVDLRASGPLPQPTPAPATSYEFGLPVDGSGKPGEMTLAEAELLLDEVEPTQWLLLTNWLLLEPALERIADGRLQAELVLVLNDLGLLEPVADPPVPVYVVSYDIRAIGFVSGVVAAQSSNNGMFIVMAGELDPHAQDYLDAVWAGAKYHTNGAMVAEAILPMNDRTGLVEPEIFRSVHLDLKEQKGEYFMSNHYIIAAGRSTATLLYSLAEQPTNAFVVGAYGDLRQARPARVLGCGLKHPGAVLEYIFSAPAAGDLAALADEQGRIQVGLDQGAVGFTDFEMYSGYHPDGDDIAEAAANVWAEIAAGELDVAELIAQHSGR